MSRPKSPYNEDVATKLKTFSDKTAYKLYVLWKKGPFEVNEIVYGLGLDLKKCRMGLYRRVFGNGPNGTCSEAYFEEDHGAHIREPKYTTNEELLKLWERLGVPMYYFRENDIEAMDDPRDCPWPEKFDNNPPEYQEYIERYEKYHEDYLKDQEFKAFEDEKRAIFMKLYDRRQEWLQSRYDRFVAETCIDQDVLGDLEDEAFEQLITEINSASERIINDKYNRITYNEWMATVKKVNSRFRT